MKNTSSVWTSLSKSILISLLIIFIACQGNDPNWEKEILQNRKEHEATLINGPRVPLLKNDLKKLKYFTLNQDYSVTGKVILIPEPDTITMPTYSGKKKQFVRYAKVHFDLASKNYQLTLYQSMRALSKGDTKHLFLPFKDFSNGESSYGGGRYLDLEVADIRDDQILLDFNACYNPWCAYSDGFSCPIPPIENHLETSILAGEMYYKK